ncbi:MAG: hypothetical protein ACFE0J_20300 [Elainellaceae cyanobacterium]
MNHPHQTFRHWATQQFIEALDQLEQHLSVSQQEASEGMHLSGNQPLDSNREALSPDTHSLDPDFKVDSLEDAVADIERYIQAQDCKIDTLNIDY